MGHSCQRPSCVTLAGPFLRKTLLGHSCGTLLSDTLVGHSCGTLLQDSCGTLWGGLLSVAFCDSLGTLSWGTLVGHPCLLEKSRVTVSRLQNERFVRDPFQKSRVMSPKRAFRTRLPPKLAIRVSKTSVSYDTPSKSHASKSPKVAFRTRLRSSLQKPYRSG